MKFTPAKDTYLVRKLTHNEKEEKFSGFEFVSSRLDPIVPGRVVELAVVWVLLDGSGDKFDDDAGDYTVGDYLFVNLTGCPKLSINGKEVYIIETLDIQGKLEHE